MASETPVATIHEAGGTSSAHDIELFRLWTKMHPEQDWKRAKVDRFDGLTLYEDKGSYTMGLHFANSVCGFIGTGPRATVTILHEAGFAGVEDLEAAVYEHGETTMRFKRPS